MCCSIVRKSADAGFTLIELLVVISIIGMLASVILVSMNGARAKARDGRRMAELSTLRTAIELFRSNNSGNFPGWYGWWAQAQNACSGWQPSTYTQLVPTYLSAIPSDPTNPGAPPECSGADGYWYYYGNGYKWNTTSVDFGYPNNYVICTKLEVPRYTFANPWGNGWTLNYCLGN